MSELALINFTRGVPATESFPLDEVIDAARAAVDHHGKVILPYGPSPGFAPLREWLAHGHEVEPDQVLIGNGSLQVMEFLLWSQLQPGDVVFTEAPTYDRTLTLLRRHRANVVGIPLQEDGPDLDALETALQQHTPKFFYLIPDFQNPAGTTCSGPKRHRIVELAQHYNFILVEDAPYRQLRYRGFEEPSLFKLAPQQVLHMSSFSKLIGPGPRIGFMLGQAETIAQLAKIAEDTYITPNYLAQGITYEWCRRGFLTPQIEKLKRLYSPRLDACLSAIDEHLPGALAIRPDGGFFISLTLPAGVLTTEVRERAKKFNLNLADGLAFFPNGGGERFLRLPFCALTPDEIHEGIHRLAQAVEAVKPPPKPHAFNNWDKRLELSDTVRLLGDLLGQVVSTEESPQLFETEERIRALAKARRAGEGQAGGRLAAEVATLMPNAARGVAAAFTLYFDLINVAEEDYRVQALRQRQRELHPNPVDESIADAIGQLKARGLTREQMAAVLNQLHIELVLTAHPTEAKRRTILSKLQRVGQGLRRLDATDLLPHEREEVLNALRAEITALWLTDQARTAKPGVTDEVRTGLYFIGEIFWEVLPRIYADLDAALAQHYPQLKSPARWLSLASWIGGDRDGNPNVTAEITAETLRLHRGLAIEQHRKALHDVSRRFSLSARRSPPPPKLKAWLEARHPLPQHVAFLERRYADEPYRLTLSLLSADLEQASQEQMTARLLENTPHTARISLSDLAQPIELIASGTPPALSQYPLHLVQQQLEIFGLHTAHLDIREDSTRLTATLGEILRALNLDTTFEQSDDLSRSRTLLRLLAQPAPQLAENPGITPDTSETWATFRLLSRVQHIYGHELLGPFIISMTHGAADVLTVLLMARWTGCADGLHIAPLFETLDDLSNAPRILADLFSQEAYRLHLARCNGEQTIMIGYSDSNKDGGYLAANWALYRAQENIARVCRESGVKLTLFHGRGGSVARGGGPANRAIRAQPPGTINGRFRMTEQGETIASRYANPDLAHRHLEQVVNAVLLSSTPLDPAAAIPSAWREALNRLARDAWRAYHALVYDTPAFLDYWHAVTPIDEISRLRIGSRPTTRRNNALKLEYVRAIPWVFSWMQSRFNLPGWYGLGAALSEHSATLNREMYEQWPFFRALLDNAEMSLLKADMGIATLYSQLAPDQACAQQIFDRVRAEYDRTVATVLTATQHANLMDSDPIIQRSIQLRNPYVDPLNYIQVDMLRRLRALPDQDGGEAEALREVIVMTVNGIASGLRNTG